MENSIDVQLIANQVSSELNSNLEINITQLLDSVSTNDLNDQEATARIHLLLKSHAENFAISLVQKVVDQLQQNQK